MAARVVLLVAMLAFVAAGVVEALAHGPPGTAFGVAAEQSGGDFGGDGDSHHPDGRCAVCQILAGYAAGQPTAASPTILDAASASPSSSISFLSAQEYLPGQARAPPA